MVCWLDRFYGSGRELIISYTRDLVYTFVERIIFDRFFGDFFVYFKGGFVRANGSGKTTFTGNLASIYSGYRIGYTPYRVLVRADKRVFKVLMESVPRVQLSLQFLMVPTPGSGSPPIRSRINYARRTKS